MANAEELFQHGMQLIAGNRRSDALFAFQQSVLRNPRHAASWANRGSILRENGDHLGAVLHLTQSLGIKEDPGTLNNRGVAWQDLGQYENALRDFVRALELDPSLVMASNNIGNLLATLGEVEKARDQYSHSLEIAPGNVEARLYRSMQDLCLGDLERGWADFEARWLCGQLPSRLFDGPQGRISQWNGEELDGRRLYLYGEQGLGDQVQFVRYAKVIKERWPSAHVCVEVGFPLVRLLRTVDGVDSIVAYGDEIKDAPDFVCPMMTAPRIMGTTFDTIPADRQYVFPDRYRSKTWARDFEQYRHITDGNKLVGLCWSGLARPMLNAANKIDARRSTNLETFAPLFMVPGVVFVSLQHGSKADQAKDPPPLAPILDNADQFGDFADTAALIANLDLVISVDTAVAHVAAAIGKPVWLLSRFDGCWRWHGSRSDSPWYPTLRQFRQPQPGNWEAMLKAVADHLRAFSLVQFMDEAAE